MREFLRRAAASFRPSDDDQVLEGLINQMNKSTIQATKAMDDALAFCDASNNRIAKMEHQHAKRMASHGHH